MTPNKQTAADKQVHELVAKLYPTIKTMVEARLRWEKERYPDLVESLGRDECESNGFKAAWKAIEEHDHTLGEIRPSFLEYRIGQGIHDGVCAEAKRKERIAKHARRHLWEGEKEAAVFRTREDDERKKRDRLDGFLAPDEGDLQDMLLDLEDLPPRVQRAVNLHWQKYSIDEIAKKMDTTRGQVRDFLAEAQQHFQDYLK